MIFHLLWGFLFEIKIVENILLRADWQGLQGCQPIPRGSQVVLIQFEALLNGPHPLVEHVTPCKIQNSIILIMRKKPDVKPPRHSYLIHLAHYHELGLPMADGVGDDSLLLKSSHHPVQQSSILFMLLHQPTLPGDSFHLPHLSLSQSVKLDNPLKVHGDGGEVPDFPLHIDALVQKFHSMGTLISYSFELLLIQFHF